MSYYGTDPAEDTSPANECDVHGVVEADGCTYEVWVDGYAPWYDRWHYNEGDIENAVIHRVSDGVDMTEAWEQGECSNELVAAVIELCEDEFKANGCVAKGSEYFDYN
jgi:hypothetical protein